MQANDVQDDASGQREAGQPRLGAVGIVGVAAGLSVPLTIGVGLVVALVLALVLAFQRRWSAVAWVLGAALAGFGAWMLFRMVDPNSEREYQIYPPGPDFVR